MSFPSEQKETPTNSEKEPESNPRPDAAAGPSKPRDKRPPSAIQLIKEDLGLFTQDLLNIFKDKDAKKSEPKEKTPLNGLKDDLGLFKNEFSSFTGDISGILRKSLRREDAAKVKAQEQSERPREEAEKEDAAKIKAQGQTELSGEREKEDGAKIKAQEQTELSGEREKEDAAKIKAQEQTELSGEREKEDAAKIKAQEQSEQPREAAEKEDAAKIKAQEQTELSGEREKEDAFKIKDNEQTEQRGKREQEDSVKTKANEQEEQEGESEREEAFKVKAQDNEKGKAFKTQVDKQDGQSGGIKEDSFKIKAQSEPSGGAEVQDSFKIKAHGDNEDEDKDDDAFKLKAPVNSRGAEKDPSCDEVDGWELLELERNENAADPKRKEPDTQDGDGGPETADADAPLTQEDPLISLSSGVSLLRLRNVENQHGDQLMDDMWTLKNFAQYLTFDPNTANLELVLSDGNRTARREWTGGHMTHQLTDHMTPEHPERFEHCPQLLCREGLLDAVYWEVRWTGGVDVGVAYNRLSRGGGVSEGLLGQNDASWSLECSRGSYTPCHRGRRLKSLSPEPFSQTVGVFLDFEAGSLSFFCVAPGSMQHLHTFTSTFTEPLYPGFWLWSWGGSVTLSQVELGWERLLQ